MSVSRFRPPESGRSRALRTHLLASCLQASKQPGVRLAQGRHCSFEFTLTLSDVLVDHLLVLKIPGNRTVYLREFQSRKRLHDLLRRCAFLEANCNRVERNTSPCDVKSAVALFD